MDDTNAQKPSGTFQSSTNFESSTINNTKDDVDDELDESSSQIIELNNRIKGEFISYCLSFLRDDGEARDCIQLIWHKYLQCVGDVAMISAFFDTLPFNIKESVLAKYQKEIIEWCRNIFHVDFNSLIYSTFYSNTLVNVIHQAFKQIHVHNSLSMRKAVIYVPIDFDPRLKQEILISVANIRFKHIESDVVQNDIISIHQLEETIKQDSNDNESLPFMVIATAGTTVFGHCDELTKIKQICASYNVWVHATGDLLGSLGLLSITEPRIKLSCDSLTLDTVKLFGIQNLPYLTLFIRPIMQIKPHVGVKNQLTQDDRFTNDNLSIGNNDKNDVSDPTHDIILRNPSINFLSIWSMSQRCSPSQTLHHMKCSFNLTNLFINALKSNKALKILHVNDHRTVLTYNGICSSSISDDPLPKSVVIFRFEAVDIPEIATLEHRDHYIDLLNGWLFEKLSQNCPKMNFELLNEFPYQVSNSNENLQNRMAAHAIRFAPLEQLLDLVDETDIATAGEQIQTFCDVLVATMTARARLSSSIAKHKNLINISVPNWAGIGAIRYLPDAIVLKEQAAPSLYDVSAMQVELVRKLQANDSAFSLGGGAFENDALCCIRLGMIRKSDDLDVLLQKIADGGRETEAELKYVEDMAEKIRMGIEKAQQDLKEENQQLLSREGLLKQIPIVSNILSWWSPSSTESAMVTKGRSFDLNSGSVESTENTYTYRMQIKRQLPQTVPSNDEAQGDAVTHAPHTDMPTNSTDNTSAQAPAK